MNKKLILIIVDGWGITKEIKYSAMYKAFTPTIDKILKEYPNTVLKASGKYVGLPDNIMGNSEVGHLNIGAGRIIPQMLKRINKYLFQNKEGFLRNIDLKKNLISTQNKGKNIHLVGLISNGGIHSHIDHLKILIKNCKTLQLNNVYIHAITDGRDSDPKSAIRFLREIKELIDNKNIVLATIVGRYYAMDRDNNLERTNIAYDALIKNKGLLVKDWEKAIIDSYNKNITDEFLMPFIIKNDKKITKIKNEDLVIFFNFRKDRPRQLIKMLTQQDLPEYSASPLKLNIYTFTEYDKTFKNIKVLFPEKIIKNTLGEILEDNKLTQTRIAETEKYPHVTYFFSGGREKPFLYETRILCPSQKVSTYDLCPQMQCFKIKQSILKEMEKKSNFILANFANLDMVGHTGNFESTIRACEYIDECLSAIIEKSFDEQYKLIITSDHGNAEKMFNTDGTPYTAHTTNDVPFILIDNDKKFKLYKGFLGNIAPTILELLNIKTPSVFTESLLK